MPRSKILTVVLIVALFSVAAGAAERADGKPKYPSLKVGGFGDFNLEVSNEANPDSPSGFENGQFVLHFVSPLSKSISFFSEVTVNAKDEEFTIEIERMFVKFDYNDNLKVAFGRFHTPINWWNTAFHHGAWLQTTITRPEMTRFGGEFIPVHFVGGIAQGSIPSGGVNLSYEAGVGNGRHENIGRPGDAGDINDSRAWLVRLTSKPNKPFGLQFGASYYDDKISSDIGEDYDEQIAGAFVVYPRETPEVIAEYTHLEREGLETGESFDSDSYYVQVAYRLPVWKARLKPYARYEEIDVADGEPVFVNQTDREGYTVGLRMDIWNYVAVKVEYRHQHSNDDPYVNAGFTQLSFAF